jgi:hypothetical protein
MDKFVVVRPYDSRIRERVFGHFQRAEISQDTGIRIPPGTSDEEAIERLRVVKGQILLIPFHGHRDDSGTFVNGLVFAKALEKELPALNQAVIIMPVSRFVAGGARLLWEMGDSGVPFSPALKARILLIFEEELDDKNLHHRIRHHIETVRGRRTVFSETSGG